MEQIKEIESANVGDWVYCYGDCFGILTHIFTKHYAPYDEVPEDSIVGDVEYRLGQYKIFSKNDGAICKRNRIRFDDCCFNKITDEDRIRLNQYIEKNQSEYQKFLSLKKELFDINVYRYHLPDDCTFDGMVQLFDSYKKEFPSRFTFIELSEFCKKKGCPIKIENYIRHGYHQEPEFSLLLYYPIENFEGQDILYDALKVFKY